MKLMHRWSDPPTSFHRWLAEHPYQWTAIVAGGFIVFGLEPALHDALIAAFLGAFAVAFGCAAFAGALLARRKVTQYDARAARGEL